jgi:hypothetical protein
MKISLSGLVLNTQRPEQLSEEKQLENRFNEQLKGWITYCEKNRVATEAATPLEIFLDNDFYKTLVSMGPRILPLIRRVYDKPCRDNIGLATIRFMCLPRLIQNIIPDFSIPPELKNSSETLQYTIDWLDRYR